MRLLVWLGLAIVIVYLARALLRRTQGRAASTSHPPRSRPTGTEPEPMRQCLHCGAYFPASEAIAEAPDRIFCSEEHRRLHHTSQ